jgi:hypothetical protein
MREKASFRREEAPFEWNHRSSVADSRVAVRRSASRPELI